MTLGDYIKDRLGEPVSGVGGTGSVFTSLLMMDPHTPQFWIVLVTGLMQIALPEINWFKQA